jgi:hypothetical protein
VSEERAKRYIDRATFPVWMQWLEREGWTLVRDADRGYIATKEGAEIKIPGWWHRGIPQAQLLGDIQKAAHLALQSRELMAAIKDHELIDRTSTSRYEVSKL